MSLEAIRTEAHMPHLGMDGALPIDEATLTELHKRDQEVLAQLNARIGENQRYFSYGTGLSCTNKDLALRMQPHYSSSTLGEITDVLTENGALGIKLLKGYTVTVDRDVVPLLIAPATDIEGANHGAMSQREWARDATQIAEAWMDQEDTDPAKAELGRQLLFSQLHLLSTPEELARFEQGMVLGREASQEQWPHIAKQLNNLQGTEFSDWRNRQEAFQQVALAVYSQILKGHIKPADLLDAHKHMLGSVMPFLQAAGYPDYPNSGAWEEDATPRTSVAAVEVAMLHTMRRAVQADPAGMRFLVEHFEHASARPDTQVRGEFSTALDDMIYDGLAHIGQRLPYECPDTDLSPVKYREADAAMAYLLRYNVPAMLAEARVPISAAGDRPLDRLSIERFILNELMTLIDPDTNAMARYAEDSYFRVNFMTNVCQWVIAEIKGRVSRGEIDLDEKQRLRGLHMPAGKPAGWTHPLGHVSSWASDRALEEHNEGNHALADWFRSTGATFLNYQLSTVTGEGQWHPAFGQDGMVELKETPAWKVPELTTRYKLPDGRIRFAVSPHMLNWATAMLDSSLHKHGRLIAAMDKLPLSLAARAMMSET